MPGTSTTTLRLGAFNNKTRRAFVGFAPEGDEPTSAAGDKVPMKGDWYDAECSFASTDVGLPVVLYGRTVVSMA